MGSSTLVKCWAARRRRCCCLRLVPLRRFRRLLCGSAQLRRLAADRFSVLCRCHRGIRYRTVPIPYLAGNKQSSACVTYCAAKAARAPSANAGDPPDKMPDETRPNGWRYFCRQRRTGDICNLTVGIDSPRSTLKRRAVDGFIAATAMAGSRTRRGRSTGGLRRVHSQREAQASR